MPELSVNTNIKAATCTKTLLKLYSLVYLGMNTTEASLMNEQIRFSYDQGLTHQLKLNRR